MVREARTGTLFLTGIFMGRIIQLPGQQVAIAGLENRTRAGISGGSPGERGFDFCAIVPRVLASLALSQTTF